MIDVRISNDEYRFYEVQGHFSNHHSLIGVRYLNEMNNMKLSANNFRFMKCSTASQIIIRLSMFDIKKEINDVRISINDFRFMK